MVFAHRKYFYTQQNHTFSLLYRTWTLKLLFASIALLILCRSLLKPFLCVTRDVLYKPFYTASANICRIFAQARRIRFVLNIPLVNVVVSNLDNIGDVLFDSGPSTRFSMNISRGENISNKALPNTYYIHNSFLHVSSFSHQNVNLVLRWKGTRPANSFR